MSAASELSVRGRQLAAGNDTSQLFEVIKNLWHPESNPDGFVSLGLAENDLMHPNMVAYIEKNFSLPHKHLTYLEGGAGSKRLQKAVARFLTKHLNPIKPFEASDVVATNGCSSALEGISYVLADPGDGFLLGRPYYRSFLPDFEMRPGSQIVKVSFGTADPMGIDAVQHYEAAIKASQSRNQKIRGLILCHPHNPLGRCYPREVIVELMKLCQKYRIHFISDEIYALSGWTNNEDTHPGPVPFISASSIDTTNLIDPHLVHIVWGMSKDFGANGLRLGYVLSQANRDLLNGLATMSLYTYPSNVADQITATILEDDAFTDAYIRENSEKLSQRFSVAARYFKDHGISYAQGANAAFFIVADLGSAYRDRHPELAKDADVMDIVMRKCFEKRVFVADSNAIGSEKPGWVRIVFSQNEDVLLEGLRRIVAAVEDGAVTSNGQSNGIPARTKLNSGNEDQGMSVMKEVEGTSAAGV